MKLIYFAFLKKKIAWLIIIFFIAFFCNSCEREIKVKENNATSLIQTAKNKTVIPNVPDCGDGYHWDFTLHQCVQDCPPGYVYCPQLGDCVLTGEGCNSNGISDNWVFQDAASSMTATFNYNLLFGNGDTTLVTSMNIVDNRLQSTIDFGSLNLNSQNIRNKDSLSSILSAHYRNIYQQYGTGNLRTYSGSIERMLTAISDTLESRKMKSLVFQSLCIYSTLSKAANRDVTSSGNVNFTIMDSYINGTSSFSCEEDEYINIPMFKAYLTSLRSTSTNPGIDYYLGALQNETANSLNVVEITNRLESYFNGNASAKVWPQGGECGCCANYDGPCLYWSKICLLHDYQCQNCTPRWFCLPGCVASSCSGNTISWYWWLF